MTRILAIAAAFLMFTITLILFQPKLGQRDTSEQIVQTAQPAPEENEVTTRNNIDPLVTTTDRLAGAEPFLAEQAITQQETVASLQEAVAKTLSAVADTEADAQFAELEAAQTTDSLGAVTSDESATSDDLRAMTWDVLRNIDKATGRTATPGAPGSLLHTIVNRSVNETSAAVETSPGDNAYLAALLGEAGATKRTTQRSVAPADRPKTYRVKQGETLQSIAFKFYGATSFYIAIYEANSATLSGPNSVTIGQSLKLP